MSYTHHDLVLAWLHGRAVQFQQDGIWMDMPHVDEAHRLPAFYVAGSYRLKPVEVRVRVWLDSSERPHLAASLQQADLAEKLPNFRTWLGDWAAHVV